MAFDNQIFKLPPKDFIFWLQTKRGGEKNVKISLNIFQNKPKI